MVSLWPTQAAGCRGTTPLVDDQNWTGSNAGDLLYDAAKQQPSQPAMTAAADDDQVSPAVGQARKNFVSCFVSLRRGPPCGVTA